MKAMKITGIRCVVITGLTLGATVCASAGTFLESNTAAPIRYMGANAGTAVSTQSATPHNTERNRPYISQYSYVSPQISTPRPLARSQHNAPTTPQSFFDNSTVDRDLYGHQKVGRPYKIAGKNYTPQHNPSYDQTGTASWYGPSYHGKYTANGEVFDMDGLTAAHKTLPLNSLVHVTNLENGKTITVRLNDRGPFIEGRIIDLSRGAAKVLGVTGLSKVRVQYAGPADPNSAQYVERAPVRVSPNTLPLLPKAQLKAPLTANLDKPSYKPLSVVPSRPDINLTPQNVSGYNAAPHVPEAFDFSTPSVPNTTDTAPLRPADSKSENRPAQDFVPPNGGAMTLTITGPIHMASADETHEARFIPAVFHGENLEISPMEIGSRYIQAAAFSTMDRAESVRHNLSAVGTFSVAEIERNGRPLYRVLVGPFTSKADADAARRSVREMGFADANIVDMH